MDLPHAHLVNDNKLLLLSNSNQAGVTFLPGNTIPIPLPGFCDMRTSPISSCKPSKILADSKSLASAVA